MNVAGREDTTRPEAADTEFELLSYLKRSDGDQCPLYDSCPSRLSGRLCPCKVLWHTSELLDSEKLPTVDCDFLELVAYDKPLQLVETLAYQYLNRGGVRAPPVPSRLIPLFDERHPIEVRLVNMKCHHGATWHIDNEWVVQLSLDDTPLVRRLTLFHEAFHILSRRNGERLLELNLYNKGRFYECLAEYFAFCLLMPASWIGDLWQQTHDLDKMSLIFEAPLPAVYMRLKYLQLL